MRSRAASMTLRWQSATSDSSRPKVEITCVARGNWIGEVFINPVKPFTVCTVNPRKTESEVDNQSSRFREIFDSSKTCLFRRECRLQHSSTSYTRCGNAATRSNQSTHWATNGLASYSHFNGNSQYAFVQISF